MSTNISLFLFAILMLFVWNGADERGGIVSSGVYYVVLIHEINGMKSQVKKEMFFLK